MKKILSYLFTMTMFLGAIGFGTSVFCRTVVKEEHLKEAIDYLDIEKIVVNEMGENYAFMGDLLNTSEAKAILSSYTDGLVAYIIDGNENIPITKDQIHDLFSAYSSTLLQQYPQLSFLPTDKFVDFMVEEIDFTSFLPQYKDLVQHIPNQYLELIKVLQSSLTQALCLAIFLFSGILVLVLNPHFIYKAISLSLVMASLLFGILAFHGEAFYPLIGLDNYSYLWEMMTHILSYLKPLILVYVILGMLMFSIGYFIERKGNQDD